MQDRRLLASFAGREAKGIDTCTTCPKLCRWACPVAEAEARETSSPWNLVVMAGYLRRGLASPDALGDFAYHCSQCGACTEACLHKNDVPFLLDLARSRTLEGHAAPAGAVEVRGNFGTAGNPYGTRLDVEMAEIVRTAQAGTETRSTRPPAAGAIVYFPGCATIREMPEAASDFLRALAVLGIGGVTVNEVSSACCGLPLLWAGDLAGFRAHAIRHAARLASADMLVVHDPACAHAMKVRYPEFGVTLAPEIVHVSAFLASRLGLADSKDGEAPSVPPLLEGRPPVRVAYADCCNLARGLRLVGPPRRLIARATGSAPIELAGLRGLEADCCGAGGLLPVTAPHAAAAMGEARLQAFRQSGASVLATFSPRCAAHLRRLDPTLEVVDGTTLLARV